MPLKSKNILLGVTGGIGAFKACELLRFFVKAGAKVRVIMTEAATKFVSPLSFQALGAEQVSTNVFEQQEYTLEHVHWADWGNILVIAPCTANMIGKLANGIADEVLSIQAVAYDGPILLAPAMNVKMYNNSAVRQNIAYLRSTGIHFIGPEVGELSSLITAEGRMSEPSAIFERTRQILVGRNDLQGQRVIVTAGPTREPLDPVRYLSNFSSGKMGYAIASAAAGFGADVVLVSGPTSIEVPPGVSPVFVETASQMLAELRKTCSGADYLYMAAAVADFRPSSFHKQKIRRAGHSLKLNLEVNPDILKSLGENRPRVVVGFALETENLEAQAYQKLRDKKVDLIVANNPTEKGVEFGSDFNRVTIIRHGAKVLKLARMEKFELAVRIIEESLRLGKAHGPAREK